MRNFDIETESFGVKGTVSIPVENTQKIAEYIRNQLKENAEKSQLTMDFDPFTASW